jgi:hypothetical protein
MSPRIIQLPMSGRERKKNGPDTANRRNPGLTTQNILAEHSAAFGTTGLVSKGGMQKRRALNRRARCPLKL